MKYFRIIVLTLLLLMLSGCSGSPIQESYEIEKGILDLRGWTTDRNSIVQLNGDWEFYWNKLLSYDDLQAAKPDLYGKVPSTWNEYSLDGRKLPGQGYATYRLHVKTSLPKDTLIGLRVYNFSSAYKLYINDKPTASNGKVAETALEEVGEYKPQAVFFSIPSQEFDIIIQASNFQYARGGFWYTMHMGSAEGILSYHDSMMAKETSLLGVLVIISLFFMTVFFLRRELRYALYFSLLCITMIVALDMVGQFILLRFFPGISFAGVIYIWYSSSTWALFFLILYVHELFKSKFSSTCVKIYLGLSIIAQALYTFVPTIIYTSYAHISNYIDMTGVACTVVIAAIGIRKGLRDGWLNILSMFIAVVAYIHDILYWTNVITNSYGELIYLGLFLILFLQMVIQAKRIRQFYDKQTAAELSFLQAQIKPHFLYNAINTFVSISRYDMDRARELLISFGDYLRKSFDFKDLRQLVPLKNELELAKAYVEIEKARFEERLQVFFEECDDMEVKVPMLTLQPVIENAINHGVLPKPEGGCVWVSIKPEGSSLLFTVKDNGIGMETSKTDSILTNQKDRGIGLFNINKRLRKLYRKGLQVSSSPGNGTVVSWRIPVNRRGRE